MTEGKKKVPMVGFEPAGIVTPELSHSTINVTSTSEVRLGSYTCSKNKCATQIDS